MIPFEPILTFATDTALGFTAMGHGRYEPSGPLDIRVMKYWGRGWVVRDMHGRWSIEFFPQGWTGYTEPT